MPKNPEPASNFTIGRSQWRIKAIHGLHVLSVSACWLNGLPVFYNLILSLMAAVSWFFQHKACDAGSIYLRYTATDGWAVSFENNDCLAIKIKPATMVGKMLTVLHFNTDNHSKTLVIFKDAMSAYDYRRLTVMLKTSGYHQG